MEPLAQHRDAPNVLTSRLTHWRTPWALALLIGMSLSLGACLIPQTEPSTFRYSCDSNADCLASEDRCIAGLCQRPCTSSTSSQDCPSDEGYALCLNGTCASTCSTSADVCPGKQTCLALSDDLAALAATLGLGFGAAEDSGYCGVACDENTQQGCPENEFCASGFCFGLDDGQTGDTGA